MPKGAFSKVYGSICGVRKQFELGCRGCVLDGTVGCPSLGGEGELAPILGPQQERGTFGSKLMESHEIPEANFPYNSDS
jgi:hypothetical protein